MTKHSSLLLTITLSVGVSLGMAACGDGGPDNADQALSTLDDAGVSQLCDDVTAAVFTDEGREGNARIVCFVLAQLGGDECDDAALEDCVDDLLAQPLPDECPITVEVLSTCEQTVGDLFDCADDTRAGFENFAGASCDQIAADFQRFSGLPDSCEAVEAACPGLLSSEVE